MSERRIVRVSREELESTIEMVSFGQPSEFTAWINIADGTVSWRSDYASSEDENEEADESEGVIPIPHKKELDLGRSLVLRFATEVMPDDADTIYEFFRGRGAYHRLKDLLRHRGMLERWYEYEKRVTKGALAAWCEDNDVELVDDPPHDRPG